MQFLIRQIKLRHFLFGGIFLLLYGCISTQQLEFQNSVYQSLGLKKNAGIILLCIKKLLRGCMFPMPMPAAPEPALTVRVWCATFTKMFTTKLWNEILPQY